jgi:hypothetical protein
MTITEQDISRFVGSIGTAAGEGLVSGGSFLSLGKSADESVIWGQCAGSGAEPYFCSVDFLDKEKPVGRCKCPSRQKPCKHTIGLLIAFQKGLAFSTEDLPAAILDVREKDRARAEKAAKPTVITKAKAASEAKKCVAQLDGISLGEKILHNITLSGLSAITDSAKAPFEAQIKELGNYYIAGVQAEFTELIAAILEGQDERDFSEAIEKITFIHALLKKGKTYLERKKADFEAFPNMTETAKADMLNSPIEEQLGYGWKLTELRDNGRLQTNAELLQVAFWAEDDDARRQWIDRGFWLSLNDKNIYETQDFRPKRANLPPNDSFHDILTSSELYVYPGDKNPRIRWEKSSYRPVESADYLKAQEAGRSDFQEVIKEVKNLIKSPLADKKPMYALRVAALWYDADDDLSITDKEQEGTRLMLKLRDYGDRLRSLSREQIAGKTLIVWFEQDMEADALFAVPMAVITDNAVIRLV